MSAITKSGNPDIDGLSASRCTIITEMFSGDSFGFLDPVYIDSTGAVKAAFADSTGLFYDGFASVACDSVAGHPVTIFGQGLIMEWIDAADSVLPGTLLYVGGTGVGGLDTAPVLAEGAVVKAISNTQVIVIK